MTPFGHLFSSSCGKLLGPSASIKRIGKKDVQIFFCLMQTKVKKKLPKIRKKMKKCKIMPKINSK